MTSHNLIVVGLVMLAIMAHIAVWWTGKWTWDGIVMGVVLCLAGMAIERNQLTSHSLATPFMQRWLIETLDRAEQIHKEQGYAIAANRTAKQARP